HSRADSEKSNMGLTTWKNAPKGHIRKTDVGIAKNYLDETELDHLNRIVTMYLDFAELQANAGRVMTMQDWVKKLDAFLQFNEREILQNAGKVSHEIASALAEREFEIFSRALDQNYISDFDRLVKNLPPAPKKGKKK
ncbi:MAG: virulence RhuM family protein, partial [Deltaproteobacteria bacterium]|nr:virulence RhuM family protein [Deltaproteobacteria bacterium]